MLGSRLKFCLLGAAALLAATSAYGADYSQPQPPVYYQPPPQIVESEAQNWYLRGFVGVGITQSRQMEYQQNPLNSSNFHVEQSSISDAFFVGGAVGYEWNNWLRFDVSGEYRGGAQVNAFGSYTNGGGTFGDSYHGNLRTFVFLANGFIDIGTWNCFTPFVGVGIGAAHTTLADFTDIGVGTSGRGIGRNSGEWSPAWALHAGLAYNVSKSLKVELAYRYLSYGSVTDTIDCIGGCNADSYKFGNLHSHDFMIGLRWQCCDVPAPPPARYVYTPPPPVYLPPPPVYQPPLRSKG